LGARRYENIRNMTHQQLATIDHRGEALPRLAQELPSRAQGTWTVRPDGTMETIYRLHGNVMWHDGEPLTARDFVFAWNVTSDPDLPIESRAVSREIASVDARDDHTLVIEWRRPYGRANAIVSDDLGPFASHLLKSSYDAGDKELFWRLPYWTHGFIGVGPYRIVEWQPGSQILLEAYDRFYAGRAKIDRIALRFIFSEDALVANLRAGAVDWSGIDLDPAIELKREWERAGQQPTLIPVRASGDVTWVQHRNPAFPQLQDPRVRRGLLHALNRELLAEAMFPERLGLVADSVIPPDDIRWEWVKDDITRYPHDVRRAEELYAEAGLRRGSDGVFANASGTRMVLPYWATAGTENERLLPINADQWKSFGVMTELAFLTRAQADDRQYRSSFPGLINASLRWDLPALEVRFVSANCPSEGNGWTGMNYGCYVNPAVDQIFDRLKAAIEPDELRGPYRDFIRLYTQELPALPLYFGASAILVRQGITGVVGAAKPEGAATWNIDQWDIE
jgi:peptide/nickel transport system substrate-binding protein